MGLALLCGELACCGPLPLRTISAAILAAAVPASRISMDFLLASWETQEREDRWSGGEGEDRWWGERIMMG